MRNQKSPRHTATYDHRNLTKSTANAATCIKVKGSACKIGIWEPFRRRIDSELSDIRRVSSASRDAPIALSASAKPGRRSAPRIRTVSLGAARGWVKNSLVQGGNGRLGQGCSDAEKHRE